jgi:AhpD family alkylhydroperoxidase
MKARIELQHANPKILQPLLAIESYLHRSSLGSRMLHLVKTRASQINGCAYCLDMHTQDARAEGESEQRLYALDAWRETPSGGQQGGSGEPPWVMKESTGSTSERSELLRCDR